MAAVWNSAWWRQMMARTLDVPRPRLPHKPVADVEVVGIGRRTRPDASAVVVPAPRPESEQGEAVLAARLTYVLVGSAFLWAGFHWTNVTQLPAHSGNVAGTFFLYWAAFACLLCSVTLKTGQERLPTVLAIACVLVGFVTSVYSEIRFANPRYGSDVLVFSHVAAEGVLRGANPYTLTVDPVVLERFDLPPQLVTQTTLGAPIERLVSYPPLHFLVFVPALALGVEDLRWVVLGFQVMACVLIGLAAPWRWKLLAIMPIFAQPDLGTYFTSGALTDWLWVFPVLATVWLMYRGSFSAAAVVFGIAAATKQQPWFLAPFLVVWLAHRLPGEPAVRARKIMTYGVVALTTFLVPNLPFMLLDGPAWLAGTLAPLLEPMIPFGEGLSLLSQLGVIDLPRQFYLAATVSVGILALVAYSLYFDRMPAAAWILPAIVMWFGFRSLHTYFLYWIPVLTLGVILEWHASRRGR